MTDCLVERDGLVKNAQTLAMYILMADAWLEANRDGDVRVIVLSGAGGNFSSGADQRVLAGDPGASSRVDVAARLAADPDLIFKGLLKSYRPTEPVIAAVEGVAIAGGTEILQGYRGSPVSRPASACRRPVGRSTPWEARPCAWPGRSPTPRRLTSS